MTGKSTRIDSIAGKVFVFLVLAVLWVVETATNEDGKVFPGMGF